MSAPTVDLYREHRGGWPKGIYRDDSLQNRLRQFYLANPDEELTYSDIAIKLGCGVATARNVVRELRMDGMLETAHVVRVKSGSRA